MYLGCNWSRCCYSGKGLFIQYDWGSYKKNQTNENVVTGMTSYDQEGIYLRCVFVTHIWNARGWS